MTQATYLSQSEKFLLKSSFNNQKINDQKSNENIKSNKDIDINTYYKYSSSNRTQRTNYNMSYNKNDMNENKKSSLAPKKINTNKVTFELSNNKKDNKNNNSLKTSLSNYESNKFRISMEDRFRMTRQSCTDDTKFVGDNSSAFRQIEEINKRNSELIKSFKAKYSN